MNIKKTGDGWKVTNKTRDYHIKKEGRKWIADEFDSQEPDPDKAHLSSTAHTTFEQALTAIVPYSHPVGLDDLLLKIGKENFSQLETLETRNSDSLDFHDVAVWEIKKALAAAFLAGTAHSNQ